MRKKHDSVWREKMNGYGMDRVLSPFKREEWLRLTPAERLDRAWRLRERIPDPESVHDRKLFPKP